MYVWQWVTIIIGIVVEYLSLSCLYHLCNEKSLKKIRAELEKGGAPIEDSEFLYIIQKMKKMSIIISLVILVIEMLILSYKYI